ncbi:MAG: hypothetical protein WBM08_12610 [Prochlorococcaceae cyanobacterium]
MKRIRHTPEQSIRKLKTAEQLIAQGKTVDDVCCAIEVTKPTYHRLRQQYGGIQAEEALAARLLRSSSASPSWRRRTPASRSFWPRPSWNNPCSGS